MNRKKYSVQDALQLLDRTPKTLHALLSGLSDEWVKQDEGPGTWSVFDVLSHLVFCERMNFFTRIQIIRSHPGTASLPPFDMRTQFDLTMGKSMSDLLADFADIRTKNLAFLRDNPISDADLERVGIHAKMGPVTLGNVLSTWVVHDLSHTAQVTRVMGKQYKEAVGPFIQYLRILN